MPSSPVHCEATDRKFIFICIEIAVSKSLQNGLVSRGRVHSVVKVILKSETEKK